MSAFTTYFITKDDAIRYIENKLLNTLSNESVECIMDIFGEDRLRNYILISSYDDCDSEFKHRRHNYEDSL